jgi:hypothetical protein
MLEKKRKEKKGPRSQAQIKDPQIPHKRAAQKAFGNDQLGYLVKGRIREEILERKKKSKNKKHPRDKTSYIRVLMGDARPRLVVKLGKEAT